MSIDCTSSKKSDDLAQRRRTKILIVDDHKILRDGLKAILRVRDDFEVIGECETGAEAVALVRRLKPEIVIMDVCLPGLTGSEATKEILRHVPETRILMLSMFDDEYSVISAIRSGARAYMLMKASDKDLIEALRIVASGGSCFSPQISDRLLRRVQQGDLQVKSPLQLGQLNTREQQVLRLVAEGKSSKEIADMLDLGLQTVRSYRKTMMKKLHVSNVAGLTQFAVAAGLTRLHQPATSALTTGRMADAHVSHFFR